MAELCLGTVQFGMNYGINNNTGQPMEEEVFEMLNTAIENGIQTIDTAHAYGTAEELLGKYLKSKKDVNSLRIISKLSSNVSKENKNETYSIVRKELENTLERLHVRSLDGYLLHSPEYIYNADIVEALNKLKAEKLVKHIGISIYELQEGYAALKAGGFDYIQLPYSVMDQRGIQEGFIDEAKNAGATVFTRSAFLQGLLMMNKNHLPKHLQCALPYLERFEQLLDKYSEDKMDVLIHFVTNEQKIDYLVFGVDNKEQLLQYVNIYKNHNISEKLMEELKETFINIDKNIIFPSLWVNSQKKNGR